MNTEEDHNKQIIEEQGKLTDQLLDAIQEANNYLDIESVSLSYSHFAAGIERGSELHRKFKTLLKSAGRIK